VSDKGKGLRETEPKPPGSLTEELIDELIEDGKLKLRHEVHLAGGHTGSITSLAVTPDGRWLVTGSDDGTARLWDIGTGTLIMIFEHRENAHLGESISAVAITPDGRRLITGSHPAYGVSTAKLWDIESAECIGVFEHEHSINAVAVTPEGRRLVTVGGNTARLWDIGAGKLVDVFEHDRAVNAVAVTPDGRHLVTGGGSIMEEGTAWVWKLETGERVREFAGYHTDVVNAVAITSDGKYLVTGSRDGTTRLWDLASGKPQGVFLGNMTGGRLGPIWALAVSQDGKWLVTGGPYLTRLWDMKSQKLVRILLPSAKAVAVTPDSQYVIIGSCDGTAQLWDIATGKHIRTFGEEVRRPYLLAVTPDGRRLAIADYDVDLWDLASGKRIKEIGRLKALRTGVEAMAVTPDGQHLVTGREDGTVQLWDLESGDEIRVFTGHTDRITAVAITPDGRWLVTGSWDHTARLWDAKTGECRRVFNGREDQINAVAVSSDGTKIVTGSCDGTAKVWDSATGECLYTFEPGGKCVHAVGVTPDGNKVITGGNIGVVVWDPRSGKRLRELKGFEYAVTAIALTSDGNRLVAVDGDKARLWDLETQKRLQVFEGHEGYVSAVAVTPDDSKLITVGGYDHTVRFWDLETGELLVTMYNLKEGFLWTTPPTPTAPSGWLWTNREDLISVVECDKEDGANPVPLPPGDNRREAYLKWVNDREMVMRRLWLSRDQIQTLEKARAERLNRPKGENTLIEKLPGLRKGGEK